MERTDFEQWRSKEVARLLALVEGERRYYQEMVAGLPAPLAVLSAEQWLVYSNRAFRSAFGLSTEEARRKTISQVIPDQGLEAAIQQTQTQRSTSVLYVTVGERRVRVALSPLPHWDDESVIETLLLAEDVTDAPAVATGPSLPADLPAIVWLADAGTLAFQTVGGAVEATLGHPAERWFAEPGFFEQRIHSDDRAATMAVYRLAIENGGEATAEFRMTRADGSAAWCRETIHVASGVITGVITGITHRKELERQLLTAARHETLRAIAGRLAHDLNNPLMIATGYGEELLRTLPEQSATHQDLTEMVVAAKRMTQVTERLAEFGRKHAKAPGRVDLNSLLPALEPDLTRLAGAGCAIEIRTSEQPVWASADREQLTGVILALASGIREGATNRTRVSLSCSVEETREHAAGIPFAGKRACIRITDNGRGVDAERQKVLFESILPEKDPSNSGWALARSYSLVSEWAGEVSVASEPNRETVFTIHLPYLTPEPVAPPAAPEAPKLELVPAEQLRETVLVVDDEAGIRGLVRKILRRERYQVLEAGSAEEALAIAVSHGGHIHLLLTDVMLPGMSGPHLARRLYEASPSLKVLYISGHADDTSIRGEEYPPGARFLPKPFTLGALVSTVRETLDS